MILKHWRISISWISKTERGIVSKGCVKYFTNLSSSNMAWQGTGKPLCDPPAVNNFLIIFNLTAEQTNVKLVFLSQCVKNDLRQFPPPK